MSLFRPSVQYTEGKKVSAVVREERGHMRGKRREGKGLPEIRRGRGEG